MSFSSVQPVKMVLWDPGYLPCPSDGGVLSCSAWGEMWGERPQHIPKGGHAGGFLVFLFNIMSLL